MYNDVRIDIENLDGNFTDIEIEEYCWSLGIILKKIPTEQCDKFLFNLLNQILGKKCGNKINLLNSFVDYFDFLNYDSKLVFIDGCCNIDKINNYNENIQIKICSILSKVFYFCDKYLMEKIYIYIVDKKDLLSNNVLYKDILTKVSEYKNENFNHEFKYELDSTWNSNRTSVSLIVPDLLSSNSFLQPPIDMLYAAAEFRDKGYEIKFIDNRTEHLTINKLAYSLLGSDVIIITTTPYDHIQNYFIDYRLKYAINCINKIKEVNKGSKVIVVGGHSSVRPDIMLRDTLADLVYSGDYDSNIVNAIDTLFSNQDIDKVDNLWSETKLYNTDKVISRTCSESISPNFMPAYDLIDFNKYYGDVYVNNKLIRKENWSIVLASRGCRNKCPFCYNFWGNKTTYRTPIDIINELELLENIYNVEEVFFIDFNITQDEKWLTELCNLYLDKNLSIKWSAQARCDSVNKSLLHKMKKANCTSLWFGVESYSDHVIKSSMKYTSAEVSINAINNCIKVGIKPNQFIMIGLPGESLESVYITIEKIKELNIPFTESVMIVTPRFGTEYYKMAKEQHPSLGDDFFSLSSAKGIVNNDLSVRDIYELIEVFSDKNSLYELGDTNEKNMQRGYIKF